MSNIFNGSASATPPELETWTNRSKGKVILRRIDPLTGRDRAEVITGGKTFTITSAERRRNSDEAATPELDVFANGFLSPVRLLDNAEDAREIADNPNLLSRSDLEALFKAHYKTFEKKVSEITHPVTLEELREVGMARDASVKQIALIDARLEEVQEVQNFTAHKAVEPENVTGVGVGMSHDPAGQFRPVTP